VVLYCGGSLSKLCAVGRFLFCGDLCLKILLWCFVMYLIFNNYWFIISVCFMCMYVFHFHISTVHVIMAKYVLLTVDTFVQYVFSMVW
jgi:hypothetical protein